MCLSPSVTHNLHMELVIRVVSINGIKSETFRGRKQNTNLDLRKCIIFEQCRYSAVKQGIKCSI